MFLFLIPSLKLMSQIQIEPKFLIEIDMWFPRIKYSYIIVYIVNNNKILA